MRRFALILLAATHAACASAGSDPVTADGGEDEADAEEFDFPDAAPRPDARQLPDAAPKADAFQNADAAPTPDAAGAPDARPPDAGVVQQLTIADGDFGLLDFDTGNVSDACTSSAPWGSSSWGIQGFSYSTSETKLAGAHFFVEEGEAYLYGKDDDDHYGLVRFIQGDVWGGSFCGAIPYKRFTPVSVAGKDVQASVKVFRDTDTTATTNASWITMAVNLWFTSPNMPAAGGDILDKKPLVLDLLFHVECNTYAGCSTNYDSVNEAGSYHYRKLVKQAPYRDWTTLDIDVGAELQAAIDEFNLGAAASTMKLYQAEVILTVRNSEAAALIDDFEINVF